MLAVALGLRILWKVLLIKGLQLLFIPHPFPPSGNRTPLCGGQCPFLPRGEAANSALHQAWAASLIRPEAGTGLKGEHEELCSGIDF